jgi:hypothetical protein
MSRVRLLVLLLAACGRIGYEPVASDGGGGAEGDASRPDAAPPDAGAPDAEPLGPFGAPLVVAALVSTALDDDPTLTEDRLEMFFNSNRPGGLGSGDIWVTRRTAAIDPWGPPEAVTELSSSAHDTTPEVSADGLTIYLSSERAGGAGAGDIWRSTRPARDLPWTAPVRVTELSTASDERSPTLLDADLTMLFSSDRPGGAGGHDIYVTARSAVADPWGAASLVVELSSPGYDSEPAPWRGGLELLFASDRGGAGTDLYASRRPSLGSPWEPPLPVEELNSTADDDDPWVSADGRYIVFASSRGGDNDIYEAFR